MEAPIKNYIVNFKTPPKGLALRKDQNAKQAQLAETNKLTKLSKLYLFTRS